MKFTEDTLHELIESIVEKTIKNLTEKNEKKTAYDIFFEKALKKFKIKSLGDLTDAESKKFFAYVEKNWTTPEEKKEHKIEKFDKSVLSLNSDFINLKD